MNFKESRSVIVATGVGGGVGARLVPRIFPRFDESVVIGRTQTKHLENVDRFIAADLATGEGLSSAIQEFPSEVDALLLFAGIDSRTAFLDLDIEEFHSCMMVNCLSSLRIFGALARKERQKPLQVVVASSDVVGKSCPRSSLYALSKAALEEGFRHALSEIRQTTVVILRLPDLGVPMAQPDGSRIASMGQREHPVLTTAIQYIHDFLRVPHPGTYMKVINFEQHYSIK